jgi:hypothetical protein
MVGGGLAYPAVAIGPAHADATRARTHDARDRTRTRPNASTPRTDARIDARERRERRKVARSDPTP